MQLQDLLAKGYFPIQLPVGFGTKPLADKIEQIKAVWDAATGKQAGASQAEKFSVARSSYSRRTTSIPNPVSFYALAKEICEYWPQIRAHYDKSKISRSIPGTDGSLRAIELTKFSDLYEARVCQSAGSRFALVTDISSYFPTVYTHTIPWALHTKQVAKANKTKKTPEFFGNILDGRCMGTQDGQTIGLPIGPDTSHIIAEIIGVSIDEAIRAELGEWPKGFRYVDDFTFFFNKRDEAEKALAIIIKCVSAYELQINASKTKIVEVRELVQESWKYSLKKLTVSARKRQQKDDIHHYFEMLFSLESRFKDESLVKYGLKQLSSTIIKKSNWAIAEAYILKCGYGFPNTLQVITQILATYHRYDYPMNMPALGAFSRNLLGSAAAANHHSETAWLLWLCKELSIYLDAPLILQVLQMESSVCSLIALDLIHSGLVDGEIDVATIPGLPVTEQALRGNNWLLAYEGGYRQWLGNSDFAFIKADPCFEALLDADISFYDDKARLPPIFQLKVDAAQAVDFDSDDEIDTEFEFNSIDEEYFDSTAPEAEEEDEAHVGPVANAGD